MTQAVDMILDALLAQLTLKMKTEIAPSSLEYADIVKKGLLQEDKTRKNVGLGIQGGDHEDPEYKDGITSLQRMPDVAMQVAAREIGGTETWWRRGVVRIECFFIRERLTEDQAFVAAYSILGRLENAIDTTSLSHLAPDSYGERPIKIYCFGNTFFESGGPPKTYIFRGKVLWQCLTERP
jgi:hypothetical protein